MKPAQYRREARAVLLICFAFCILSLAAHGKSDPMIADRLHMSVHTVDSHMRKIFRKLETNNRTMAVVKALTLGLIHL